MGNRASRAASTRVQSAPAVARHEPEFAAALPSDSRSQARPAGPPSSPLNRTPPPRAPALRDAEQRIVTNRLLGKIEALRRFPPGTDIVQHARQLQIEGHHLLEAHLNDSLGDDGTDASDAALQQEIGGAVALREVQLGRTTPAALADETEAVLTRFLQHPSPSNAQSIYPAIQRSALFANKVERNPLELGYDLVQQTQEMLQKECKPTAQKLLHALHDGDAEKIAQIGTFLHAARLDTHTLTSLLASKNDWGEPGLYFALEKGHTNAVTAYLALVRSFDLCTENAIPLVEAKRADGAPGAFMALQNGHAGTFTAYASGIRRFGFPRQINERLIEAKDYRGIPGAYFALINGHADTFTAFAQALLPFGFSQQTNERLIEPKSGPAAPAAYFAMSFGHPKSIEALGEAVFRPEFKLSSAAQLRIMTADYLGLPGIFAALGQEKRNVADAWAKIVRQHFSPTMRALLFNTGCSQDLTALFLDFRQHLGVSSATTDTFVRTLRELGLDKIAAAGLPAFRAQASGPPEAGSAGDKADFIAALKQLGFSDADAASLFHRGPAQPIPILSGLAMAGNHGAVTLAIEAFALQELGPGEGATFLTARTPDGKTAWQHAETAGHAQVLLALSKGIRTLGVNSADLGMVMGLEPARPEHA